MKISWARVGAVVDKEMADVRRHKLIVWSMVLVPLIMVLVTVGTMVGLQYVPPDEKPADLAKKEAYLPPELAALPMGTAMTILLNDQYLLYFLLIPSILPIVIAAHSIIGEKELKSLEPLLATPITTFELLVGKSVAAVSIPVLLTWLSYGITAAVAYGCTPDPVFRYMVRPAWLVGMGLLSPMLGWLSVLTAVIISSRVNDARVAQQLGGLVCIPIIGGSTAVLLGKLFLTGLHMVLTAIMLLFVLLVVFVLAVELFERETIVTRWK